MRLVGRAKLVSLAQRDERTAKWISSWVAEFRDANWKRPTDVTGQFPTVRLGNDGTFLFIVPRHKVGIHVLITFAQGIALIIAIRVLDTANGH